MNKKEQQVSTWWYRGEKLESESPRVPLWATAFIYRILKYYTKDHTENNVGGVIVYIGKKQLQSTTRSKIGVREKAATKTRKTFKKTTKESGWQNYWSSCKELQEAVKKQPELYRREIIEFCYSKKNATYLEVKHIIKNDMLEKETYNRNLLGSIYIHDTDRQLYDEFLERKRKPKIE